MEKAFLTAIEIDAIITCIATSLDVLEAGKISWGYKPHEFGPTIEQALNTLQVAGTVRELSIVRAKVSVL